MTTWNEKQAERIGDAMEASCQAGHALSLHDPSRQQVEKARDELAYGASVLQNLLDGHVI